MAANISFFYKKIICSIN